MNDTMRSNRQQFFWGSIILIVLSGSVGCSKSGSSSLTFTPVSYVSILNEAPYGTAVDIYLNDTLVSPVGGIATGQYSTQYGSVKPGVYKVDFKKAGTDSLLFEIPASSFDTTSFYTLLLYNTAPGNPAVQAIKILDNFTSITNSYAYYRFFNLSPDASAADFYLDNTIVQHQRTPADNASNLSYNQFQSINPAIYNLQVTVSGTDSVLAMSNAVTLGQGGVYTIFLSGTKSANNLAISVLPASY